MERRRATQSIDGDKLDFYINQKCWNDEILAVAAYISTKTIERGRKGEPISNDSINCIAAALDITPDRLILRPPVNGVFRSASGDNIKIDVDPETRSEINIIVGIRPQEFRDINKLYDFIIDIKQTIGAKDEICPRIRGKADSGTLITLEMSKPDIVRFIASMMSGELKQNCVTGIDMHDDIWIIRALLLIKLRKSPSDIDVEAWSDLINSIEEEVELKKILSGWIERLSHFK